MAHSSPYAIHAGPKGTVALVVGRANMDKRNVWLNVPFLKHSWYFVQENWNAVGVACVHGCPHVAADEEADGLKMFCIQSAITL